MIMPMYTFKCSKCGAREEVVRPMDESYNPVVCKTCVPLRFMARDFKSDLPHAAADRYDSPIISDSMAMAIDQIPEHKKMFPDIQVTPEGQPVFDNFAQHEAYLDKCGFVKQKKKKANNSGKTVYKLSEMKALIETRKAFIQ